MSEAKGRVLIVDDSRSIRSSVSRKLEAEGYEDVTAADAREALDTLSRQDFDLVLPDIKMPGMSGMEVLSRMAADHPDVGVLMITAVADAKMAVEAMKLGAYDYVTKPFESDDLIVRAEKAFAREEIALEELNTLRGRECTEAGVGALAVGDFRESSSSVKGFAERISHLLSSEAGTIDECHASSDDYVPVVQTSKTGGRPSEVDAVGKAVGIGNV